MLVNMELSQKDYFAIRQHMPLAKTNHSKITTNALPDA